jgi:diamine N-acetyltransferase
MLFMTVELRPITENNWHDCCKLKVAEDQKRFVATNSVSLVQAAYEKHLLPLAVYDGETMVGFVMFSKERHPQWGYWIIRLMVDEAHQRKGYGRATIKEVLRRLGEWPDCAEVFISEVPDNVVAARLYESLGFVKTGEVAGDEVVMKYTFPAGGQGDR